MVTCYSLVKIVAAIGIAKVTKVMIASQMTEELITIHIALIAVLAQRMPTMRCVLRIALRIVCYQLGLRVAAAFECKDLQILYAQIAEIHVVFA